MAPAARKRPSAFDKFPNASAAAVSSGFSAVMAMGPQPKVGSASRSGGAASGAAAGGGGGDGAGPSVNSTNTRGSGDNNDTSSRTLVSDDDNTWLHNLQSMSELHHDKGNSSISLGGGAAGGVAGSALADDDMSDGDSDVSRIGVASCALA